jgi:hypothetical protein
MVHLLSTDTDVKQGVTYRLLTPDTYFLNARIQALVPQWDKFLSEGVVCAICDTHTHTHPVYIAVRIKLVAIAVFVPLHGGKVKHVTWP